MSNFAKISEFFLKKKKHNFVSQNHIHTKISRIFCSKFGNWYQKLKLKTQIPANSFGPSAETLSNF